MLCVQAREAKRDYKHYERLFSVLIAPRRPPPGSLAWADNLNTYHLLLKAEINWINSLLALNTFDGVDTARSVAQNSGVFHPDADRGAFDDLACMGLHERFPWMLLRLGRDQECFDFLKTWFQRSWTGGLKLDANGSACDSFDSFICNFVCLSHVIAMTLLKIRLLLDLKTLQIASELRTKMPQELVDRVKSFLPLSDIISGDRNIIFRNDYKTYIKELEGQVDKFLKDIQKKDRHYLAILIDPGQHLEVAGTLRYPTWPSRRRINYELEYSYEAVAETLRYPICPPGDRLSYELEYSYDAWVETPGAIDFIRAKMNGL